jgi:hypothetical protein
MRTLEPEEAKMLVSKTAPPVIEEIKQDLVVPTPKKTTKRKKTQRKKKSTLKLRKVR